MNWLSAYDCFLFALMLIQLWRPTHRVVHPVLLVTGFLFKHFIVANPLFTTRLLVLLVSVVQVFVVAPVVRFVKRHNTETTTTTTQPPHATSTTPFANMKITCLHQHDVSRPEHHHIATSGFLCSNCSAYRIQYQWQNRSYSMLLPPSDSPCGVIERYSAAIDEDTSKTKKVCWPKPIKLKSIWWVVDNERVVDLMPAALEIIGPERDGHARLTNRDSLGVKPLQVMVWMSSFASARPVALPKPCTTEHQLHLELFTGEVVQYAIDSAEFSVHDLVLLCTRSPEIASADAKK